MITCGIIDRFLNFKIFTKIHCESIDKIKTKHW